MQVKIAAILFTLGFLGLTGSSSGTEESAETNPLEDLSLDLDTVAHLANNPFECFDKQFPTKLFYVMNNESDLALPQENHPIFYGCFDWHSSVHGHWLLALVRNKFPGTELAKNVTKLFNEQFQEDKSAGELAFFQEERNKPYERTYGWTWFLKLQQELLQNEDSESEVWSRSLQPLADHLVSSYKSFLPNLVYPQRVGTHTNTAFGLMFAMEYAEFVQDQELVDLIKHNASNFFLKDKECPLTWEPSGADFLSPCLQEADLMTRVIDSDEDFFEWIQAFLPQLFDEEFHLEPGKVIDRTDGHLVHLDGVNFSRAWNIYTIALKLPKEQREKYNDRLMSMADEHIRASMDQVVGADYAGSHWLASFLMYALQQREKLFNLRK